MTATKTRFNASFTFEAFIGHCDASSHGFLAGAGALTDPLLIYGHSGYGKTHLLHAIGNKLTSNNKEGRFRLINGDQWTDQCIAIDEIFEVDGLLIDDVQMLLTNTRSLDDLEKIIVHFKSTGKLLVMTADSPLSNAFPPAAAMAKIFGSVTTARVEMPSRTDLMEFIQIFSAQENITLDNEVTEFLLKAVAHASEPISWIKRQILGASGALPPDCLIKTKHE
jgi:chromosomal replication initiator protein